MVWYGIESEEVDVRLRDLAPGPEGVGSRFRLEAGGESVDVNLPLHGLYNAENCLAAAACSWALGLSLREIAEAVRDVKPASMRGVVHRGRFTVVDDSYNSNPRSLLSIVRTIGESRTVSLRRIVVAGEMLELGPESAEMHREVGMEIARSGIDVLWGVRGLAREMIEGARASGMKAEAARYFESSEEAAEAVVKEVRDGDLILVKGSRGVSTDKVVAALCEHFPLLGEDERI